MSKEGYCSGGDKDGCQGSYDYTRECEAGNKPVRNNKG